MFPDTDGHTMMLPTRLFELRCVSIVLKEIDFSMPLE